MNTNKIARHRFIQFLAASLLFAGLGPGSLLASAVSESLLTPVTSPDGALDVFDFERVAALISPGTAQSSNPLRRQRNERK